MNDTMRGKKLGTILVETGLLTMEQLAHATAYANALGCPVGQACVRLGYVNEEHVVDALATQLGVPRVRLRDLAIPAAILSLVPASLARRHRVVPVSLNRSTRPGRWSLLVAIADPRDIPALDDLAFVTGHRIVAAVTDSADLDGALSRHYGIGVEAESLVDLSDGPGLAHVTKGYFDADLSRPV